MKIELNSHELRIVMSALDRSHKKVSNKIRTARELRAQIESDHELWCNTEIEYCYPPYEEVIDGLIEDRAEIVALKAKILSLTKK